MRRIPIIAGNWKMYKTRDDALDFIYRVNGKMPSVDLVETVLFTSPIYLRTLVKRQEENLRIGAQNMHFENEGAYTGEISASMLKNIGVTWVLIGHSERRQYFNETDESVNKKLKKALASELKPMVCVGESLEIREKGETDSFVKNQVVKAYQDITKQEALKTVLAYEPIWAIGTGKTATPKDANDTIKAIRKVLKELYNDEIANQIRILYGGSVKPTNLAELLKESDIDGALIGGASLDANSYLEMTIIGSKKA